MARSTMRVDGLRELEKALAELPNATGKNVLRRTGRKALEPVRDAAQAKAPKQQGDLAASIAIGTKLTSRQAKIHRKTFKNDKAAIELFVGPNDPAAVPEEFGWVHGMAQPYMRPAWDGNKSQVLQIVKVESWTEIDRAAKRLARKAARQAAKG